MKYQALIIDDVYAAEALKNLLQGIFPEIHICFTTHSTTKAVMAIKKHQPEIMFLDISLAEIFEFIFSPVFDLHKRIIIFTFNTGESYQTKLLANAVDFLAKPFCADTVSTLVPNAIRHFELLQTDPDAASIYKQSLVNLRDQIENHLPVEKITIPLRFGYQIINLAEMVYLQADENYTILYLTDSRVLVSNHETERFLQILPVKCFFQINPFTIINLKFVNMRSGPAGKTLLMLDGTTLSVSRSRLTEFDKKMA